MDSKFRNPDQEKRTTQQNKMPENKQKTEDKRKGNEGWDEGQEKRPDVRATDEENTIAQPAPKNQNTKGSNKTNTTK
jgi:hypothetical protein